MFGLPENFGSPICNSKQFVKKTCTVGQHLCLTFSVLTGDPEGGFTQEWAETHEERAAHRAQQVGRGRTVAEPPAQQAVMDADDEERKYTHLQLYKCKDEVFMWFFVFFDKNTHSLI